MSLRLVVFLLLLGLGSGVAEAGPGLRDPGFEHGGGCRKDSPPGRCCHMDRSTGVVHCH